MESNLPMQSLSLSRLAFVAAIASTANALLPSGVMRNYLVADATAEGWELCWEEAFGTVSCALTVARICKFVPDRGCSIYL